MEPCWLCCNDTCMEPKWLFVHALVGWILIGASWAVSLHQGLVVSSLCDCPPTQDNCRCAAGCLEAAGLQGEWPQCTQEGGPDSMAMVYEAWPHVVYFRQLCGGWRILGEAAMPGKD